MVAAGSITWGGLFFDRFAPLYILLPLSADLGASPQWVGALALLLGFAWALAMPLARLVSGRWSHRQRLVGATVCALVASLASLFATNWGWFIVLRALSSLAAGTAAPAITGLAFAHVPARRRGLDLGLVQSSTRLLGSLISPIVVTAIFVAGGWRLALVASAGVVSVGIVSILALAPRGSGLRTQVDDAYRLHPWGRRNLAICVGVATLLLTWLLVVSQSVVPLLTSWLDTDEATAGLLLSLFGVGAWLSAIAIPALSDRTGRTQALIGGAAVGATAGLSLAGAATAGMLTDAPLVVGALLLLSGTATGCLPLVISIIPAEAVASGDVGRALEGPVVGTEIIGGALLPAAAMYLTSYMGFAPVIGLSAALLLAVIGLGPLLSDSQPGDALHGPTE